jgi:hypothetical protein
MNVKNKVLWMAMCVGCLALGISYAADATKKISLDDSKAVLEKLKTDGKIKQYKLNPVENGLLKLDLSQSGIIDLTPLQGMSIEWLHVDGNDHSPSMVVTLAGLEGMPLKELSLQGNVALEDISAIKGAPLTVFKISGTHGGLPKVKDLSALAGMKLEMVSLGCESKDVNVLKGMPLKSVHLAGAVTDISALKGLQLTTISLHGASALSDIGPLAGMPLTSIDLVGAGNISDLGPLKGMKFTGLSIPSKVMDLSPLAGMPLGSLDLGSTKVTDLGPLKEMTQLRSLSLPTSVTDLGPLKGLKLTSLNANACRQLADISALEGMPLEYLNLMNTKVADLRPLKGMPLQSLSLNSTLWAQPVPVTDLSPLAGLPLKSLDISCVQDPRELDVSQLVECKALETLGMSPTAKTKGLDTLRKHAALKTINGQPAAEFWKKRDEGKK